MSSILRLPTRRTGLASLAAITLSLGLGVAHADTFVIQPVAPAQPVATVDRHVELVADLLMWEAAGMDKYRADGADVFGAQYRQDHDAYVALRNSPQFALVEQSIAQGHNPTVAILSEEPLRVSIAHL